jgi:hypothetical protein
MLLIVRSLVIAAVSPSTSTEVEVQAKVGFASASKKLTLSGHAVNRQVLISAEN